jgi:hypothetical protein
VLNLNHKLNLSQDINSGFQGILIYVTVISESPAYLKISEIIDSDRPKLKPRLRLKLRTKLRLRNKSRPLRIMREKQSTIFWPSNGKKR